MALPATTILEIRADGADTNGGGFILGAAGTDYSQQAAAQYTYTDLAVDATTNTKVTSASHSFAAADVGNLLNVSAGASWTVGIYQIVSVASGAATLDRSPAATSTTGGTFAVGGALASPGKASGALTVGKVYVKTGAYVITTASTNVAGGCVSASSALVFIGYNTNRNMFNTDTKPSITLDTGVTSATMFTNGAIFNLKLDGNLEATSKGISAGGSYNCEFTQFTNSAATGFCYHCSFHDCTTAVVCSGGAAYCTAYANAFASFSGVTVCCVAYANTVTPFTGLFNINSVAYGNTGATTDGATVVSSNLAVWINCIFESNGRYGLESGSTSYTDHVAINCATYGNGTAATNNLLQTTGILTPSASVFVDAANGDFRLNNTANAGALLRAAGWPTSLPGLASSLNYTDVGALIHLMTGGAHGFVG